MTISNNSENENQAPQAHEHIIKKPIATQTGPKDEQGNRRPIGKIYLPQEWIGLSVICSTTWKDGETIPGKNRKTNPQIIRDEYEPSRIITAINRKVCRHNAGHTIAGRISVPYQWIGKDVLIRPQTESSGNQPHQGAE